MTFYSYMIKNYKGKGGPKADLANDMCSEKEFPRVNSDGYDEIVAYLQSKGACTSCNSVFKQAWAEYLEVCCDDQLKSAAAVLHRYCQGKYGPFPDQCKSCKIRYLVGCSRPDQDTTDVPVFWDLDKYGQTEDDQF